jgi:hypothetical protein
MIDSKDIEKAMDAVDKVILRHGKAWAMESAYNQYLAERQKIESMPECFAKSVMMFGAAASLIGRLKEISFSSFRAKGAKASKSNTVYIRGIEPDSVYSGAALLEAINKELQ